MIGSDDSVMASPIYDNGGTLFPNLSEAGMKTVLTDPKEIMQRIKLYPKAALEMHKTKVGYYDMMSSGIYSKLTGAVIRIVLHIRDSMPAVRDFIDGGSLIWAHGRGLRMALSIPEKILKPIGCMRGWLTDEMPAIYMTAL